MRTFLQKSKATQPAASTKASIFNLQRTIGNQAGLRVHRSNAEEGNVGLTGTESRRFGHDFSPIPIRPPAAGASTPRVMRLVESEPQRGQAQPGRPAGSQQAEVPSRIHEVLRSPGQTLDGGARDFMETRFGHDFSHVRVHTGPRAEESVRAVNAVAYTVGSDIAFDSGRYAPGTQQGLRLLAHELTHVVQQGGQPASRVDKLSMTEPGDAHEMEANRVAAAVMDGGSVPSKGDSRTILARQVDAGVASAGTHGNAPVAGVAAPAKAPVAPPSATFGKVAVDARADRIPPAKSVDVPVALADIPAGSSASIDVEGSGAGNGTAILTAGASLTATGKVTVKGGVQTPAGNAGKLNLRAQVAGAVVGRSAGFTVAAWPTDYTDVLVADIDAGGALGLSVQDGWSSDGTGAISELDEVQISERVNLQSRDNPPFTTVGAISAAPAAGHTSGYLAGDSLTGDSHTYGRANIDTTGLAARLWSIIYGQLCIFKCARTGVADLVLPKSGFVINHSVLRLPFTGWRHMATKMGKGVTVEGRTATAGACDATSKLHAL